MSFYTVAGLPYSDELRHHGIKGQKWGIRRFENPDGTLTPAGKERYTRKLLNNQIKKNEKIMTNLRESPLNKFDVIQKRNLKTLSKLEQENAKNTSALDRYSRMDSKKQRKIDRVMRLRNIGNSSMKSITRRLSDKYVDTNLYDHKKSNARYVAGYVSAFVSMAVPIVVVANSKKIGEYWVRHHNW